MSSSPDLLSYQQQSYDLSHPRTDNVRLEYSNSVLAVAGLPLTTVAPLQNVQTEHCCAPDFSVGYSRSCACHGPPPWVTLAAGLLAGPVYAVLSRAFTFLQEVTGLSFKRCESRRLLTSTSRSLISVIIGLFSAPHQVQWACLYVHRPICIELTAKAVTHPGLFRQRLKTHFLVWLTEFSDDKYETAMHLTSYCNRCHINTCMMMMMVMMMKMIKCLTCKDTPEPTEIEISLPQFTGNVYPLPLWYCKQAWTASPALPTYFSMTILRLHVDLFF